MMKSSLLCIVFALAASSATPGFGQDDKETSSSQTTKAAADTFSGKITFHRGDGLTYDLTVTNGEVTGSQHWRSAAKPNCRVVGGWFDFQQSTLSLLLQGADHLDGKWRAQVQQFRIDRQTKQVTLEHMLYGYGLTNENTAIQVHHELDVLDRIETLAQ